MATFELTGPDGQTYDVDAPDEQSALSAFKKMQAMEAARSADAQRQTGVGAFDTTMQNVRAFGNKATDWMMLGKKDEILSGMQAPIEALARDKPLGQAYSDVLGRREAEAALYEEQAPIADNAGAVVGAITGPAARAGAGFVNRGATLLSRAGRAIIPGTITGTIAGAEGDTLGDRASGAAWGAAGGALIAPVAQAGGELLGRFISALTRGKTTLPQVAQGRIQDPAQAALQQPQGQVQVSAANMDAGVKELMKRLEMDGVNVPQLLQAAQAGHLDDRTIAGLAGPNTRQLIDTYASMNGPAKTMVAGAQRAAEQGQTPAIMKAAGQSLGVKQGFTDLADVLEAQKAQAGPLYDKFYAISPDRLDTPFLQNLLKNPMSKELLGTARTINQIEKMAGETPDDVFQLLLDADGNVAAGKTLSPQAFDYVKRAIDQKVRENMDPMTGKIKGAVGQAWDKLRRAFLANADQTLPEYAAARAEFAGPAAMEDALQFGRNILKEDWIASSKVIEEMTKSEKEALKVGAFQAIDDMLSGISNKADKAARFANIEKHLNRLWPAFDSKRAFDAFKKSVMAQTAEFGAVQMAGKGSQTAVRAADALDQGFETAANASGAVAGSKASLLNLGKGAVRWLSAPNTQARAAAVSAGLGKIKDVLPYLTPAASVAPPVLGSALSAASMIPASKTKAMAQALGGAR